MVRVRVALAVWDDGYRCGGSRERCLKSVGQVPSRAGGRWEPAEADTPPGRWQQRWRTPAGEAVDVLTEPPIYPNRTDDNVQADRLAEGEAEFSTATLGKGAGISLAGRGLGSALTALQEILLARLLGSQSYGVYSLGTAFLQILLIPATLGLNQGVIRFGAPTWRTEPPRFREVLLKSIGFSAASASAIGLVLFLLAPWLGGAFFGKPALVPVLRVIALCIPLAALLRVAAAATRVSLRMKYSVLSEDVLQPLVFVLAFLLLYAAGYRLGGALAALLLSFGLGLSLAAAFVIRLYRPQLAAPRGAFPARALLAFSLVTAANAAVTLLISRVDRLVVGYFLPAGDVGIYQAASQVAIVFTMIVGAFNVVLAPMVPDLYHRGQFDRLEELYRVGARWAIYVSLPVFISVVILRTELLGIVFGEEYMRGAAPMVILSLGQMVNVATGGVGFLMMMTGRQQKLLTISAVVLVGNLILSIALTPRFGLVGAATATALTVSALFAWAILDVRKAYRIWPYDRRLVKGAIAGIAAALVIGVASRVWAVSSVWHLLVVGALAVAAFGGALLLLGLEQEDRVFAGQIAERLLPGRSPRDQR